MTVSVRTISYGDWGRCVEVTNGIVDAVATLDFGPRIIRYGFSGQSNMFWEDRDRVSKHTVKRFTDVDQTWYNYGGHRLWISPEGFPQSYYPDNHPVDWTSTASGVILTPPEEKWTQLQKQIEISMNESGEVTVIHRITNTGAWPTELSIWALSVMSPGGTAIIPQGKEDTDLLPNKLLALWPYSRMNDKRVTWGEDYILLRQGPGQTPFKLGTNNGSGWAAYSNDGNLFLKYYEHRPDAVYPDFGVSFEAYCCDHFLELETLGGLRILNPGETSVHRETWNLFRDTALPLGNETILDKELQHYMKGRTHDHDRYVECDSR